MQLPLIFGWPKKHQNGFFPCRTWPPVLAPTSASTPVASHRPTSRWCPSPMRRTEGRSRSWRQNGQGVAKWCTPALDPCKVGVFLERWKMVVGKMGKGLGRILFEVALVGLVEKYSSKFPQFLRGMIAACFNRWPFGVSRNSEFVHPSVSGCFPTSQTVSSCFKISSIPPTSHPCSLQLFFAI